MSKPSKSSHRRTIWSWRRWIASAQQDFWIERLQVAGYGTWTITDRPGRIRVLLAIYQEKHAKAVALQRQFGGQVRPVLESEWIDSHPVPPTRIGHRLEIIHAATHKRPTCPHLHIPHGMAFGSGDHATTHMLLQALTCRDHWRGATVLDVGSGSGILALAARLFGATKIVAIDFDAEAVRTARQNEALNFSTPLIRWRRADVQHLGTKFRYNLVLANLFSGILCEAAPQLAASVASEGQLWLSGILRTQRDDVITAYHRQELKLNKIVQRGKWIMLQWGKKGLSG